MIERQPEDAQTLYAELLTLLLAREGEREWSHLAGAFSTKSIRGNDYVYFQYSDPGGTKRQFTIGRSSRVIEKLVAEYRQQRASQEEDLAQIDRLAKLLRSAGAAIVPTAAARVLHGLGDAGVFRLGGVLVGTHAFLVLCNSLGVRWPSAAWTTQDVDIAGGLQVATPIIEADVPKALESLQMGFVPVPQFDNDHPSTSFKVRGKQLRVDLITPGSDKDLAPIFIPRFRAPAAPIKYLSLLMVEAQPAAAIGGGASLVVVPTPARFALHKLLVSQSRSAVQHTKTGKDLHQAALLLELLAEDRPEDLESAARAFAAAKQPVVMRLQRAMSAAEKRWPEAAAGIEIVRRHLAG